VAGGHGGWAGGRGLILRSADPVLFVPRTSSRARTVPVVNKALAAVVVMDVLAFIACSKIATAKGRAGGSIYGLAGIAGVIIVALQKPTIAGGPNGDDVSRLAWLRSDGTPWTQRADWLTSVGVVAAAIVALAFYSSEPKGTLSGPGVSSSIQDALQSRLGSLGLDGSEITVDCPDAPMKSGYVFDCDLSGYPDGFYTHLRVTEDDASGHFHYEAY
jgi:hypothetical protein